MPVLKLRVASPGNNGICLDFDAELSWTVRDIKARVQQITGTPASQQRLLVPESSSMFQHHAFALDDFECLSSSVPPGVTSVQLCLALRSAEQADWLHRVKLEPMALEYASESVRADREVLREAVKKCGSALRFASPALAADRVLVLEAVAQNGGALMYATAALRDDRGFVLEAIKLGPGALLVAPEALRSDRSFVVDAVCVNPSALATVP
ncbi:unnamed protein product, partial [Polarella glacialis]